MDVIPVRPARTRIRTRRNESAYQHCNSPRPKRYHAGPVCQLTRPSFQQLQPVQRFQINIDITIVWQTITVGCRKFINVLRELRGAVQKYTLYQ